MILNVIVAVIVCVAVYCLTVVAVEKLELDRPARRITWLLALLVMLVVLWVLLIGPAVGGALP